MVKTIRFFAIPRLTSAYLGFARHKSLGTSRSAQVRNSQLRFVTGIYTPTLSRAACLAGDLNPQSSLN
ncbi:hypothetical protein LC613_14880 [Nostoc sphaeroides CHAB 2801]|uniref:hypothetical protein n=1 Tax=Nostoc sphaeroides TaxID=446679 RepID=UPI001C70135D|nr:hypothetical protein [Nostoc sphaeroides]MCC5629286.1 hypothetical protein [Nostoc sphaeroides CHAB 2801]